LGKNLIWIDVVPGTFKELGKMKVEIPPEYIDLCTNWHSGQDSMFYAISSTGALSLGSIRPVDRDSEALFVNDEEWMLSLLNSLECEIRDCLKYASKDTTVEEDFELLTQFLEFTNKMIADLNWIESNNVS
jgi:hypothetical protein